MRGKTLWLVIGLVVIIAGAGAYVLFHNSDNDKTSTQNSSSSSSKQATTTAVVITKTDPKLGQYLAEPSGAPLYTYGADTTGVSNCMDTCLTYWPIYGPVSSSSSLPTDITIITRTDGKVQYAYKGAPLYTFTYDTAGTPTGDGSENFHIATP